MLSAGPETVELELKEDFLDWKTPDKNIGIDSIVSRIPMSHSRPPRPKNGSIPLDKFDSIIFEEIQESERMFVRFSLSKTTFLIPGLGYSLILTVKWLTHDLSPERVDQDFLENCGHPISDLYDINAVMLMFFNHLKAYHEYKRMNDSKNDSILNSDQIIAL